MEPSSGEPDLRARVTRGVRNRRADGSEHRRRSAEDRPAFDL